MQWHHAPRRNSWRYEGIVRDIVTIVVWAHKGDAKADAAAVPKVVGGMVDAQLGRVVALYCGCSRPGSSFVGNDKGLSMQAKL